MADERPHPTAIESRVNDLRDKYRNERQKAFFLIEALRLASSNLRLSFMSLLDSSKISGKLLLANLSASMRKKAFCRSLRYLSRRSFTRDSIAVGCGLSSAIENPFN